MFTGVRSKVPLLLACTVRPVGVTRRSGRRLVEGQAEGADLGHVAAEADLAAQVHEPASARQLAAQSDLAAVIGVFDAVMVFEAEQRRRLRQRAAGRGQVGSVAHLEEAGADEAFKSEGVAGQQRGDEVGLLAEQLDARVADEAAVAQAGRRLAGDDRAGRAAVGVLVDARQQGAAVRGGLEVGRVALQEEGVALDAEGPGVVEPVAERGRGRR